MAKYRPVDVRVWTDKKVCSLTQEARLLWLFLLTSPSTIAIPGVVIGGRASLAEQFGSTPERFDQLFAELISKGLEVRRSGRLIWLPNAMKYQKPHNPNMVRGWASAWDDIPDEDIKSDIWEVLRITCKDYSKLFRQLFAQPFSEPSQQGLAEQLHDPLPEQLVDASSQDQDQDQDQDQEDPSKRSGEEHEDQEILSNYVPDTAPAEPAPKKRTRRTRSLEERFARLHPRDLLATDQFLKMLIAKIPDCKPSTWEWTEKCANRIRWAECFHQMVVTDKRTYEAIWPVMKWVMNPDNDRYGFVVMCPEALREKYDRINAMMRRVTSSDGGLGAVRLAPRSINDAVDRAVAALESMENTDDKQAVG